MLGRAVLREHSPADVGRDRGLPRERGASGAEELERDHEVLRAEAEAAQRQAAEAAARKTQTGDPTQPRHWSLPVLLGAVIGTLVTFTSVGAGAIGVTVLLLVYPLLPLPRIIGADIAYAVPLTLVAGLGHASLGSVDWPLLAKLLAPALPFAQRVTFGLEKTRRRCRRARFPPRRRR